MDKQRFTDRILETENLTDELEDEDASWLLDWGVARLDQVLQGVEEDEIAGSRVNALMAVMRKINRIVGSYADKSPQRLADDLAELYDLFTTAFHSPGKPPANPDTPSSQSPGSPPGEEQSPLKQAKLPDESGPLPPPAESRPFNLWRFLKTLVFSSSSQAPENQRPSKPDLDSERTGSSAAAPSHGPSTPDFALAAEHLSQLSPSDALHYLAQDFFPLS